MLCSWVLQSYNLPLPSRTFAVHLIVSSLRITDVSISLLPPFNFFLKIGWIFSTGSCKSSAGEPAVTFETRKLLWVGEVASLCRHCRDLIGSGNYETKRDGAGAHVNHVSQLLCWEQHSPRICSRLFGVIRYVPAPKVLASQTSWEWIDKRVESYVADST